MRALAGALEHTGRVRTRSLERALATESLQRGCVGPTLPDAHGGLLCEVGRPG